MRDYVRTIESRGMSLSFQIEATCGEARAGRLSTPHGEVETRVFMTCGTLGLVKGVPQEILEELGVEILLVNTYHLYLRPGATLVRQLGGLHKFMSWERALLTDSGGFQVFSLSQLRKVSEEGVEFRSHLDGSTHMFTAESTMAAQISLGADIIMAFDECTEFPAERRRAQQSMELTVRWAERSKKHFEAHKHEIPWTLLEHASLWVISALLKSRPVTKHLEDTVSYMSTIHPPLIITAIPLLSFPSYSP